LVTCYCEKGEYPRARELLATLADADPKDSMIPINLAYILMLEKNYDAALREFEKAVALAPNDPGAKADEADNYLYWGELKKSR